jgi:holin-like protein
MQSALAVRGLDLPVPGPVVGMLILLAAFAVRDRPPAGVDAVADRMLANLSLLFVPAGVGVMQYLDLIADEWAPIALALLGSTVITLAVTAALAAATLPPRGSER